MTRMSLSQHDPIRLKRYFLLCASGWSLLITAMLAVLYDQEHGLGSANHPHLLSLVSSLALIWLAVLAVMIFFYRRLNRQFQAHAQFESSLKKERDFTNAVLDTAGSLIIVADRQGRIVRFNHACEKVSGFTFSEVQGLVIWQTSLLAPEDIEPLKRLYGEMLLSPPTATHLDTWLARDGSRHLIQWSNTLLYDDRREVEYIVGIGQDITDQHQAEQALRDSQQRLAEIFDFLPDATFVIDPEGRVRAWNRAMEEMTGTRADQVLGRGDHEYALAFYGDRRPVLIDFVLHPEQLEEQRYPVLSREGDTLQVETCVPCYKGREAWILVKAAPLYDSAGRLTGAVAMIRDITERKGMEAKLRLSEEKYRSLFEASRDAIFIADSDTGHITDLNNAAAQLMGMPREALIGLHQSRLHPPEEAEIYRQYFGTHREHNELIANALIQRASGERVPVEISGAIFHVGDRLFVQGVFRDMTERRREEAQRRKLEEQIRHAQKLESLGVLAGGIAHDFNNLLMGVLGYADLALLELPFDSPTRTNIEQIMTSAHRAADLTRQMLAYSGKGKFVIQPIDLSHLVLEMAQLLEVSISKKAHLRYYCADRLPAFEGDATQLRQVIMNLITNASDALGDKSGIITVRTGTMQVDRAYLRDIVLDENLPSGNYVFMEVSDTGCGMDAATLGKIFDPFFTTKFTGRGLGLAAVLGIVRGHKGGIKVYSEPARGTTIKVLFPAVAKPIEEPLLQPAEPQSWRGEGTILIVDDEEAVRSVTRLSLEQAGFNVLTAIDGREGVDTFRAHQQDIILVLLDMTMPRMDGEEAFSEIRRICADARIILSSGYNEQEATQRFIGRGLAGFIQKPYRPGDLIDKVRELLTQPPPAEPLD